jgi:sulfur carrier protein
MRLTVNGEVKEHVDGTTVTTLLKTENVEQPDMVSVQRNGAFVDRKNFDTTTLTEGDTVDFLYFMGGGEK